MLCTLELHLIILLQHFSYFINIVCYFLFKRDHYVSAALCLSTCPYMLKFYTISSIKMYKIVVYL